MKHRGLVDCLSPVASVVWCGAVGIKDDLGPDETVVPQENGNMTRTKNRYKMVQDYPCSEE